MTKSNLCLPDDSLSLQPAFIIGVTGTLDPAGYNDWPLDLKNEDVNIAAIRDQVFAILDWVRGVDAQGELCDCWLDPVVKKVETEKSCPSDSPMRYHSRWRSLNLGNTPIIVLSSLAPGIDTLVAEAALAYAEKRGANVSVRAPLPFQLSRYRKSSAFRNSDEAGTLLSKVEYSQRMRRLRHLLKLLRNQKGFLLQRDLFEVVLHEDALRITDPYPPTPAQQEEKERLLRYRAAGEYVAAYSDMLLAFYEDLHGGELTGNPKNKKDYRDKYVPEPHAIVEVKRRGLTDGLLPIPHTISWADTGPVLHIPIHRRKSAESNDGGNDLSQRPLRMLQPIDVLPETATCKEKDNDDPVWQENGVRLLHAITRSLARFCRDGAFVESDRSVEALEARRKKARCSLAERLGVPCSEGRIKLDSQCEISIAQQRCLKLAEECNCFSFLNYAFFRGKVGAAARQCDDKVRKWHLTLFLWALASIMCFITSSSDLRGVIGKLPSFFIFVLATTAFGALFVQHRRFSNEGVEDRQFDYRAIAEGLRVQFYWSLSGLFTAVASRYSQRLYGELSWIRCAISSVTFPYSRTRSWFFRQSCEDQLAILRAVDAGWIREQLGYFREKTRETALMQEVFEMAASAFFLAGVFLAVGSVFLGTQPWIKYLLAYKCFLLVGILSGLLLVVIIGAVRCRLRHWATSLIQHVGSEPRLLGKWLGCRLATQEQVKAVALTMNTACVVLSGIVLALLAADIPQWLDGQAGEPDHLNLYVAHIKALLLAVSGLIFLWAEKNFFVENHRRYTGMYELFSGAEKRMAEKLEQLKDTITNKVHARVIILDIQALLQALGEEALAENAEWIVMRRTRRIEPPDMPF